MIALGAVRAELGLPPIERTPGLAKAVWVQSAAWDDFLNAAAHLTLSARVTCGASGAALYALETLTRWANELTVDQLDGLAAELIAEAAKHNRTAA